MKYYEGVSTFKYSWPQVAAAFWRRYPNPQSTHVLSEDVVSRYVGKDGCLYTKRIMAKTNKLPKWGERFVPGGTRQLYVLEESVVDPRNRTFTTYTRNLGLKSIMCVDEKCTYKLSETNAAVTEVIKQAWIVSSLYGFGRALQHFGYERFKGNTKKANKGFEAVLSLLYPHPEPSSTAVQTKIAASKEKLKESAIKAKDIAKLKAVSVVASN